MSSNRPMFTGYPRVEIRDATRPQQQKPPPPNPRQLPPLSSKQKQSDSSTHPQTTIDSTQPRQAMNSGMINDHHITLLRNNQDVPLGTRSPPSDPRRGLSRDKQQTVNIQTPSLTNQQTPHYSSFESHSSPPLQPQRQQNATTVAATPSSSQPPVLSPPVQRSSLASPPVQRSQLTSPPPPNHGTQQTLQPTPSGKQTKDDAAEKRKRMRELVSEFEEQKRRTLALSNDSITDIRSYLTQSQSSNATTANTSSIDISKMSRGALEKELNYLRRQYSDTIKEHSMSQERLRRENLNAERMYQQIINNQKQEIETFSAQKQQQTVSTPGSGTDFERKCRQLSNQLRFKEVEYDRQIAELKEQLEEETRENLRINRRLLLITRQYEIQQDTLTELGATAKKHAEELEKLRSQYHEKHQNKDDEIKNLLEAMREKDSKLDSIKLTKDIDYQLLIDLQKRYEQLQRTNQDLSREFEIQRQAIEEKDITMRSLMSMREDLIRELDTKSNELERIKKSMEPRKTSIEDNQTPNSVKGTATMAVPKTATPNFKRFL